MKFLCYFLCLATTLRLATPAPANGFAFPDDSRRQKKLEPIITPPVLPILEHLERDPSTLLPNETSSPAFRHVPTPNHRPSSPPNPRFGGGFSVKPNSNGGVTASFSGSAGGPGASHSASQSFSFGFNQGFSASHSASQSASFSSGFSNSGFSGSQASSQAASFAGNSASAAASSSSAFAGGSNSGSQSASSAFGFNSLNGFQPQPEASFGEGLLDIRHRGIPDFPFPDFPGFSGRSKGIGAAAFRSGRQKPLNGKDDFLAVVVSD